MKKHRIPYFDYVKGLLIILVVLGHAMPENKIFHIWLYTWHMPAFFIVSGMLLRYSGYVYKPFCRKSGIFYNGIVRLIVPYFIYACCLLVARWINSGFDISNLRWQSIDLLTLCGIGATWFLPCLFVGQIIYYLVSKALTIWPKSILRNIWSFALAMLLIEIAVFVPSINFITLVLYRGFVAAGFIIIGDLLLQFITYIRSGSSKMICSGTVLVCVTNIAVFWMTGINDASLVLEYK